MLLYSMFEYLMADHRVIGILTLSMISQFVALKISIPLRVIVHVAMLFSLLNSL